MSQAPFTKTLGVPFIELQSVDSTNNYAREQIRSVTLTGRQTPITDGTCFFAHEQYAGKGQRGREWNSEKGSNIAMSILVDPAPLRLSQQFHLSACVAVSLCEFFKNYAGTETSVKWPNDLYWQDRKAGGVLIENIIGSNETSPQPGSQGGHWNYAIIGIGININQTLFPTSLPNPVSLKQITGKTYDTVKLARECCAIINNNYQQLLLKGPKTLLAAYNDQLYKKGKIVKFRRDNRVFEAELLKVTASGDLLVKHAVEEQFSFGQVEMLIGQATI